MPTYRRAYVPGGSFFLTLVTYNRKPLFTASHNVARLRSALTVVQQQYPFEIVAAVVLLEHLHFIWTLPPGDPDFSKRIGRLKVLFTQSMRGRRKTPQDVSQSRLNHRESDVWQRRFWEHTIRDEWDFQRHMDYIHYNPVKHELATCPHRWVYSSFGRWVRQGAYTADWCCKCDGRKTKPPNFSDIEETVGE
jgi:putative transposase